MKISVDPTGFVVLQADISICKLSPDDAATLAADIAASAREARRAEVSHNRRAAIEQRKANGLGVKGPKPNDYGGKRFGHLTALHVTRKMPVFWLCRCDCGETVEVKSHNLVNGRRRSCGCRATRKIASEGIDLARRSWSSMKMRCRAKAGSSYERYSSQGIDYCAEWENFKQFLADMGERPHGTTLDRIDPTKGYYKDNCRWATSTEQSRNRKNVRLCEADVAQIKKELAAGTATQKELAFRFGVKTHVVHAISSGRSWLDVQAAA